MVLMSTKDASLSLEAPLNDITTMSDPVRSTWNVTHETIRREYGFSERTERRTRSSGAFNESCLGSLFIVQRMRLSHFVNCTVRSVFGMSFKHDRSLICTSSSDRRIYVHDWLKDTPINSFSTKHSDQIYDLKFLNIAGNGLDVISACLGGQVRHTCVAPAGNFTSRRIFLNTRQRHRLITVPRSPLEFVAASRNGGIFQIDLRSERWSPTPDAIVSNGRTGYYMAIEDIAHHPLVPEVCVCGDEKSVHVFDKRNLKCAVRRIFPSVSFVSGGDAVRFVSNCAYNYDGSEILANYVREGAFLFDNKCHNTGEFLQCFGRTDLALFGNGMNFFGPKSEHIICVLSRGEILFQDKDTAAPIGRRFEDLGIDLSASFTRKEMQVHPHLPVAATSTVSQKISIWAPTHLKSCLMNNEILSNGLFV